MYLNMYHYSNSMLSTLKETYPGHSAVAIVRPGPGTVPVTQTHSPCPPPRTQASPTAPLSLGSSYRTKYTTYKARTRQTLEQKP